MSDEVDLYPCDSFRVRLKNPEQIKVSIVSGSATPVHLSLFLRDRASLSNPPSTREQGAVLGIDMTRNNAEKLVAEIQRVLELPQSPL